MSVLKLANKPGELLRELLTHVYIDVRKLCKGVKALVKIRKETLIKADQHLLESSRNVCRDAVATVT